MVTMELSKIIAFLIGIFLINLGAHASPKPDFTQGQAVVDGMLAYSKDGKGKLTIEGPAARIFFIKMSDDRITLKQPTDECSPVITKSGDHLECSHCIAPRKTKSDVASYWCVMNFATEHGTVVPNSTFAP
jgi:hypothetical protein